MCMGGGGVLTSDTFGHLAWGNSGVLLLNTEITMFNVMSITKCSLGRGFVAS